jgi:GTP cyclohydrolase II
LKYFPESDLHLSLPTIQKGAHMLQPLGVEALVLISNAPRKGVALNHSHLLPPKMHENPSKI